MSCQRTPVCPASGAAHALPSLSRRNFCPTTATLHSPAVQVHLRLALSPAAIPILFSRRAILPRSVPETFSDLLRPPRPAASEFRSLDDARARNEPRPTH